MLNTLSIQTTKPAETVLDYEALRKAGLDYIQKVSSKLWTDYNVHDPGITTLELLCFAITDLGYRANYDVKDVITSDTNNDQNLRNQFYTALNILPNKPLTLIDYRKLIIDVKGVKNAWLKLKTDDSIYFDRIHSELTHTNTGEKIHIKGYYDVLLEFDSDTRLHALYPGSYTTAQIQTLIEGLIDNLLMDNRNLCEDFLPARKVPTQDFILCAEIEITPEADPLEVDAQVFFAIQQLLTPLVRQYSLQQMYDKGYTTDQVFEGPALTNGFICDEELSLAELPREIHLSDVINKIMSVEGVTAIREIKFNQFNPVVAPLSKWIIPVPDGAQPRVDVLNSNNLFYKKNIPFRPVHADVNTRFGQLTEAFEIANENITEDISVPLGEYKNIGEYYSLQNHFPQVYGLSESGPPRDSSPERKISIKQHKGYLLFFDQVLANYFAQLNKVRELFSFGDGVTQTYFSQVVTTFLNSVDGTAPVYINPSGAAASIQALVEGDDLFFDRRNRFLNHLLARFAESFNEYAWILYHSNDLFLKEDIIPAKEKFLQDYSTISKGRGAAYNYKGSTVWNSSNISGFEERIGRLLGFNHVNRRNLADPVLPPPDSNTPVYDITHPTSTQWGFQVFNYFVTGSSPLLMENVSSNFGDSENHAYEKLIQVINLGLTEDAYTPIPATGGFKLEIRNSSGVSLALSSDIYAVAQVGIDLLISVFKTFYYQEGMFMVENMLLKPDPLPAVSAFLPLCSDPSSDDYGDTDPYSFRISIVLPAYDRRFLNMNIRRYAEEVIRMETPAHIFPKICWVSWEQMRDFESAYKDWIDAKAAGMTGTAYIAILTAFIDALTSLNSVYFPSELDDCSPGNPAPQLFILNQNSLGTL